jgi:predicted Zn-dependent protease
VTHAQRIAAVVGALIVCAWFGLGIRQQSSFDEAKRRVSTFERPSAAEATRTATLLDRAQTLTPDRRVDLLRAQLALQQDRPAQARRLIERVLAKEPDNVEAWTRLAFATAASDPEASKLAAAQVLRLAPRVPAP